MNEFIVNLNLAQLRKAVIEHLLAWNNYQEQMSGYRDGGASMADVNHAYDELLKSITNLDNFIK